MENFDKMLYIPVIFDKENIDECFVCMLHSMLV